MAKFHRLQFRLRTLLIMMTALAACLGAHVGRVHRERAARVEIERHFGTVTYTYQQNTSVDGVVADCEAIPPGPAWMRRIVGDDFFTSISQVHFRMGSLNGDHDLRCLDGLPGLQGLVADSIPVGDAGLAYLARFPRLSCLALGRTCVTDAGAPHLRVLRRLEHLSMSCPDLTDAGAAVLDDLRQLTYLDLSGTPITDDGLKHIAALTNLRLLRLRGARVTDAGLRHLKPMVGLVDLDINLTATTPGGRKTLRCALPYCRIDPPDGESRWFPRDTTLDEVRAAAIDAEEAHSLSLSGAAINDDALRYLATLYNLVTLDLCETCVTDAGLEQLVNLPNLANLLLEGTRVGDTGLRHLARLKSLRVVSLGGTDVTDAGIREFRRVSPNCRVYLCRKRNSSTTAVKRPPGDQRLRRQPRR